MSINLDEKFRHLRHLLDDDFGYLGEKDYEIINAEIDKAVQIQKKIKTEISVLILNLHVPQTDLLKL